MGVQGVQPAGPRMNVETTMTTMTTTTRQMQMRQQVRPRWWSTGWAMYLFLAESLWMWSLLPALVLVPLLPGVR